MITKIEIRKALARGYGSPKNSAKELDGDLINAMTEEIDRLINPPHNCWLCEKPVQKETAPIGFNMGAGPRYVCKECSDKMSEVEKTYLIQSVMEGSK